jgi:putative PIN family toxin of toxin-antitoxin system
VRRVVVDPGVLVSALITPAGVPAQLLAQVWSRELELIASFSLLEELEEVLGRQKFRRYVDRETVSDYLARLRHHSLVFEDPTAPPPLRSADPKDDYLIALAHDRNAVLVSGDKHLLDLGGGAPILAPADLLAAV